MEDYFDKLLYLIVGCIYFFLSHTKRSNTEKHTTEDRPAGAPTVPATDADWSSTWEDKTKETPVEKFCLQPVVKEAPSPSVQRTTTQLATQQRPGQKINRILYRRHGGWKEAVIMSELIRPYG
jgi:hypothetical protein